MDGRPRLVGTGRFGRCYATSKDGRPVALKVLSKAKLGDRDLDRARREAVLHRPLRHPNICRLLAAIDTSRSVCIVLELCDASLHDHLKLHAPLELGLAKRITADVADGLAYIHAFNMIHRDIKPHNILVVRHGDDGMVAKLTDFGYATRGPLATGMVGTPAYMAPEMLERVMYGYLVDVWALGCTIHAMVDNGHSPFRDVDPKATFARIRRMEPARRTPKPAEEIVALMLVEPGRRIELSVVQTWARDGQPPGQPPGQTPPANVLQSGQRAPTPRVQQHPLRPKRRDAGKVLQVPRQCARAQQGLQHAQECRVCDR